MSKLTLDIDALQVESFGTANAATVERGTVHGNAMSKISCPVATDPCLCDPIHVLTEKGC